MKRKIELQNDVFEGISSVFAKKGGWDFTTSGSGSSAKESLVISADTDMYEFPVSDDSGFNFDTGSPSVENFKIKGLSAAWVNTFTPGDGSITLEIPCNETNILELCFGVTAENASITLPKSVIGGEETTKTFEGKAFSAPQKAVTLGLMILNDTEDKMLFIKKAKFMAQIIFDGSNKPLCVVLTGNISNAADKTAFGVLDLATA